MSFTNTVFLVAIMAMSVMCREPMPEDSYTWEEKWHYDMPIDHFSFGDQRTFNLRYLINTEYWDGNQDAPVFFYCGNEMTIESFANNTGFMWDEAPKFNAMLLFIEHRYYGKSMPFGDESGKSLENLQHLSSAQALADFAEVIIRLKKTWPGMAKSPVIAFGGSYGAMLAAWMRIKYPHVVVGAISSSGPILQFPRQAPCWTYAAKVTKDYAEAGERADDTVRRSWPAMRRLAQTAEGRAFLNKEFNVCPSDRLTKYDDVDFLVSQVTSAFGNMAMLNYPYPTSFVKPLPAYPVTYSAKFLKYDENASDKQLASGMQRAMGSFLNYTGDMTCLSSDAGSEGFGFWPFQCCTDLALPHCQNGTDMFEVEEWNEEKNADQCAKDYWGTRPRYDWATNNYGSDKLTWATNIVFINGDMDPWQGGGVTKPYPGMDSSIHIINIKNAAHHLDLRSEHPLDPIWTRNARVEMRQVMREWAQYKF